MNAEQRARLARARNYAGYRSAAFARETGTLVVVLRDDAEECGPGLRWVTLCDDHSHLVGHETLADARSHASNPLGWCEACMGVAPGEDDWMADLSESERENYAAWQAIERERSSR